MINFLYPLSLQRKMYKQIQSDLQKFASKERAKVSQSFFKTGRGQYAEGDIFIGITVPEQRMVAKKYALASLTDMQELLLSKIHEYRLTALLILVHQFKQANEKERKSLFDFYVKNTKRINNWDLVDSSAPNIVGMYLLEKDKTILYKLAQSKDLWEKRISIVATLAFIKQNQFEDTLRLSQLFLTEEHDLMHKATGWMLREVGKKDPATLEIFLKKYAPAMPRTMLRYAIEKFPQEKRRLYLQKTI